MQDLYRGETGAYWIELHRHARELDVVSLVREMAVLRSKVSFYESRIKAMNDFKDLMDKD